MEAIREARKHIGNAKDFLNNNAKKQHGIYYDKKYVKIAGRTAYTGILLALNELLGEKNRKTPKSEDWYLAEIGKLDRNMPAKFATAHQVLHISMGYGGSQSERIASLGLKEAEKIISWVETRLEKTEH